MGAGRRFVRRFETAVGDVPTEAEFNALRRAPRLRKIQVEGQTKPHHHLLGLVHRTLAPLRCSCAAWSPAARGGGAESGPGGRLGRARPASAGRLEDELKVWTHPAPAVRHGLQCRLALGMLPLASAWLDLLDGCCHDPAHSARATLWSVTTTLHTSLRGRCRQLLPSRRAGAPRERDPGGAPGCNCSAPIDDFATCTHLREQPIGERREPHRRVRPPYFPSPSHLRMTASDASSPRPNRSTSENQTPI